MTRGCRKPDTMSKRSREIVTCDECDAQGTRTYIFGNHKKLGSLWSCSRVYAYMLGLPVRVSL